MPSNKGFDWETLARSSSPRKADNLSLSLQKPWAYRHSLLTYEEEGLMRQDPPPDAFRSLVS